MVVCPHCAAPLRSPNSKFCTACGKSLLPAAPAAQTPVEPLVVQQPLPVVTPSANLVPPAPKIAPTPRPISTPVAAPVVAPDPLAAENEEVASWRWNWGAFLVPGIWLLAHRIRPKIVPLVLLGVPIAIFLVTTVTSIFAARAAEHASASSVNQGYDDTAYFLWSTTTSLTGGLLAFYFLACLLSIRSARIASLDAWRNFPQQRLAAFKTAQRAWAVGGILLCTMLIGLNVYVQSNFIRTQAAKDEAFAREDRLRQHFWASQGTGKRKVVYRFYLPTVMSSDLNCIVEIGGKYRSAAYYTFSNNILTVTGSKTVKSDPAIGSHTYKLSSDEQTLTEVGGDGLVLHPSKN